MDMTTINQWTTNRWAGRAGGERKEGHQLTAHGGGLFLCRGPPVFTKESFRKTRAA
jgi:hypothetical protein